MDFQSVALCQASFGVQALQLPRCEIFSRLPPHKAGQIQDDIYRHTSCPHELLLVRHADATRLLVSLEASDAPILCLPLNNGIFESPSHPSMRLRSPLIAHNQPRWQVSSRQYVVSGARMTSSVLCRFWLREACAAQGQERPVPPPKERGHVEPHAPCRGRICAAMRVALMGDCPALISGSPARSDAAVTRATIAIRVQAVCREVGVASVAVGGREGAGRVWDGRDADIVARSGGWATLQHSILARRVRNEYPCASNPVLDAGGVLEMRGSNWERIRIQLSIM
ncbi:hypothetical protein B0H19DRAFT_1265516 [Mycena capillaripes]|nr:hypothetical protein B0H19DRAFT_1265516 [Mycena capillaripes]